MSAAVLARICSKTVKTAAHTKVAARLKVMSDVVTSKVAATLAKSKKR